MKQYCVYHSQKGTGSGGGLGNHIDRVPGREHTYHNADPNRKHLNQEFAKKYKGKSLSESIAERLKEGYNGKRKIRTDAKKYIANILTGSHERMTEIFKDKQLANEWLKENYKFACEEFGKDNIVRFTLHMDEKTPHIHCVTVPLTKDGRLSAKEIFGNAKQLKERQDKYAERMAKFGLERGEERRLTGAKHETAQEYRARINAEAKKEEFQPVKSLLGVKTKETIEKAKKELKQANFNIAEQEVKLQKKEKQIQKHIGQISKLEKEVQEINEDTQILVNKLYSALRYDDIGEEVREEFNIPHFKSRQEEQREKELNRKKHEQALKRLSEERKQEQDKTQKRGFRR